MEEDITEKSVDEILAGASQEEMETPTNQGETETPETKQEKPEVDVNTVLAQKDHFRTKAEKLEKEIAELRGKTSPDSNLTLQAIMIGKKLDKYSDDEIFSVAKVIKSDKPEDILNALENSFVKRGIEAERQEKNNLKKIPGSSTSDMGQPSKNYRDIAKMSKDEFREYAKQQEKGKSTGI